jgi:hypothetical protein
VDTLFHFTLGLLQKPAIRQASAPFLDSLQNPQLSKQARLKTIHFKNPSLGKQAHLFTSLHLVFGVLTWKELLYSLTH